MKLIALWKSRGKKKSNFLNKVVILTMYTEYISHLHSYIFFSVRLAFCGNAFSKLNLKQKEEWKEKKRKKKAFSINQIQITWKYQLTYEDKNNCLKINFISTFSFKGAKNITFSERKTSKKKQQMYIWVAFFFFFFSFFIRGVCFL